MGYKKSGEVQGDHNFHPALLCKMNARIISDSRRRRSYMFVSFDADVSPEDLGEQFEALNTFTYVLFQLERCPTTDRLHYQGILCLSEGTTAAAINRQMSANVSLRARIKSLKNCITYCSKAETRVKGPWSFGTKPQQGERSDLSEYAHWCIGQTDIRKVIRRDPLTFLRYSRGVQTVMAATAPRRTLPPVVVLLYGPPGTGKTRTIYDNYALDDIYVKQTDDAFYDGYHGQDVFVLDDFAGRASKMSLKFMLMLLDRYPVRLPVKGSTVELLATRIYITTNVHPMNWYDYSDRAGQWDCISRRIHQIIWYKSQTEQIALTKESFFDRWYQGCVEDEVFVSRLTALPAIPGNQEEADLDASLGSQDSPIVV